MYIKSYHLIQFQKQINKSQINQSIMASFINLATILLISAILRIVPIIYLSNLQSILKYPPVLLFTDIDYKVYTDAALLYDNPYEKHTYRYTPLIAYAMKFNTHFQYAGKLIFVLGDLLAIIFIWLISSGSKHQSTLTKLYAYNPLFIYLTVRGSCQSFGMALMYCFLWLWYGSRNSTGNFQGLLNMDTVKKTKYLQQCQKSSFLRQFLSYCVFGIWVHYRVYPIVFVPFLTFQIFRTEKKFFSFFVKFIKFGVISGSVFLLLGWYFYELYGQKFIDQSYLYHFSRKDNRHSFSPFFYEIYLNLDNQTIVRSMMRVIPQLYILAIISQKLYLSPFNKVFLITYSFVAFNRVITMQYYMWVLGALILVLPESEILTKNQSRKGYSIFMQWILGIAIWIWLSMKLQGKGQNLFTLMWVCCLGKMFSQLWALVLFLDTIKRKDLIPVPTSQIQKPLQNGKKSKTK